jgi:hypothetical protein
MVWTQGDHLSVSVLPPFLDPEVTYHTVYRSSLVRLQRAALDVCDHTARQLISREKAGEKDVLGSDSSCISLSTLHSLPSGSGTAIPNRIIILL